MSPQVLLVHQQGCALRMYRCFLVQGYVCVARANLSLLWSLCSWTHVYSPCLDCAEPSDSVARLVDPQQRLFEA